MTKDRTEKIKQDAFHSCAVPSFYIKNLSSIDESKQDFYEYVYKKGTLTLEDMT